MSNTFADLGVPEDLVAALAANGIEEPFEIQAATIPHVLAGRDVCGRAPTGSGKTIAFGVPLLARISRAQKRRPTSLILAPTRELAAQICRDLEPLAGSRARRVAAVYGGVGYELQRRQLNRGVDVLVACPGRLEDLLQQNALSLEDVEVVVIDEADRMADMGFLPAVKRLLDRTPDARQTLLFSATLDGAVGVLTREYQRDAVRHEAGAVEPDGLGAHHVFWKLEGPKRVQAVADVVPVAGPTIVFCRTRRGADRLAQQLEKTGLSAETIHGGRSQNQRDRALAAFTNGNVHALIATDVAARGIHVDGVACVVHFDTPEDEKAYLHRSGRTARAGAAGVVLSFVPGADRRTVERWQKKLDLPGRMTHPDLSALADLVEVPPVFEVRAARPEKPRQQQPRSPRSQKKHGGDSRGRPPGAVRNRNGRGPRDADARRRAS